MRSIQSDRIAVIDVLRAIALFGIVITHAGMAYLAGPSPPNFGVFSGADGLVDECVRVLTVGKFFSIFSFLFGLSFAIQLQRSEQKGKSFSLRFIWRLAILFAIGFVHNAFFSGDILVIYALLGLLLIPLRRLSAKILVPLALLLVFNAPGIVMGFIDMNEPPPTAAEQRVQAESAQQFQQTAQRQLQIKQSGSAAELIRMNVTESFFGKFAFQIATGRLWITFGFFLLGMCAGRAGIFQHTTEHESFFRALVLWVGAPALLTTILTIVYPVGMMMRDPSQLLVYAIWCMQQVLLSAFYVAGATLLYWNRFAGGALERLAPMGKMGLTTYLSQSAFGLIVFYGIGFGLLGHVGVAMCVGLGIAFYIAQIFFSQWWMRSFSQGPVEWLWRTLTYFKLQPMAQPKASAV